MFTDLVGFTAFTEANGDEAAADLAEEFCARIGELNAVHSAEEVKTLGDGCMIRVPEASCAAELGLEIVTSLGPAAGLPDVRVGIDAGSAVHRNSDWFGMTVNRAARLADLADVRAVLVTDAVQRLAPKHGTARFVERGAVALHGISGPVRTFTAEFVGSKADESAIADIRGA